MALTTNQKHDCARKLAGEMFVKALATATFTHTDLFNAASSTDDWIDANQTSYNNALPLPFRSDATTAQKTLLFCYVALKRAGLI